MDVRLCASCAGLWPRSKGTRKNASSASINSHRAGPIVDLFGATPGCSTSMRLFPLPIQRPHTPHDTPRPCHTPYTQHRGFAAALCSGGPPSWSFRCLLPLLSVSIGHAHAPRPHSSSRRTLCRPTKPHQLLQWTTRCSSASAVTAWRRLGIASTGPTSRLMPTGGGSLHGTLRAGRDRGP